MYIFGPFGPQLFQRWMAYSTGLIVIQWTSIRKTHGAIQWIENYPVDSAIHFLKYWGEINIINPFTVLTKRAVQILFQDSL